MMQHTAQARSGLGVGALVLGFEVRNELLRLGLENSVSG